MKKLICIVEVHEPSGDDNDIEQEICELIAGAFVNIVALLDYSANNTISTSIVKDDLTNE
jgi:hypothetical protein